MKENYNQLLINIQKQFGSSVDKISQLKLLQESIEFSTKKVLGFNTLRRFFGFLEFTKPNQKTLNILSQYLGYSNYGSYHKNYLKDTEWLNWNQIIKIELSDDIKEEDIIWLQSQIKTDEYHLKIASICKTFVYRKNFKALNSFFDPRIFDFKEVDKLKLAANICSFFRSLDNKSIKKIVKVLTPNIVFRENILHWFVDYTHLNGYYGAFLREAIQQDNLDEHESLFYDLTINYNHYLSGKTNFKLITIDRIKDDFYIVLIGRCYAYNLIYYYKQGDTDSYENTWRLFLKIITKSEQVSLLSVEILPTLLLLKDFNKTSFFVEKHYEDILTLYNWSGHHVQAVTLLALCIDNLHENKIKEATINFNFIDLSKFSLSYKEYISLFYLIVKYKLAVANSESEHELKKIVSEYISIVNETGFKRFTLDFLKNY